MLRLHRVSTDRAVSGWHDDLLVGLNAGIALAHLRIHSNPDVVSQFQELLGQAWTVYRTGHTVGLEKGNIQLVFADLLDRGQSFVGAPAQLVAERREQGLPLAEG